MEFHWALLQSLIERNQVQGRSHQTRAPSCKEGVWFCNSECLPPLVGVGGWLLQAPVALLHAWAFSVLSVYSFGPSSTYSLVQHFSFNCWLFENGWVGGSDRSASIFSDKKGTESHLWASYCIGGRGGMKEAFHSLVSFLLWNHSDHSSPFLCPTACLMSSFSLDYSC